jgi:predicted PurR-regulated permease PerM
VDLAVAVGMVSGLLFIVPYLGTAVGIVVASGLSVLAYGLDWHVLGVLGVFGGVQLIEGMALTPWIVGDKVGLHPLVVMIALLVGGNLFGIAGMLLAIPATAAAQVLLLEWIQAYRASDAFTDD